MSMIIDGTNGLTFNNATTQASAGVVLQVVQTTYGTETTNNTDTYADTGLTATITPKFSTSKILIIANNNFSKFSNASSGATVNLVRGSTQIIQFAWGIGYSGTTTTATASAGVCYLDSPATTSATTYKMQFKNATNAGGVHAQETATTATMTLLEIAG